MKGSPTWVRSRRRKRAKEKKIVRAMAKKQRIKRSRIHEVMRLRKMERRMERMKKRMRKKWRIKEEGSSQHLIVEELQEILVEVINSAVEEAGKKEAQTPSTSTQVLFNFCCPYQISHIFSVCEIYDNWNMSHNSY